MKRAVWSVALVALLALGGCGSSEDEQATQAIADYLVEQQKDDQMIALEESEADCIAGDMVDGIGVDKLEEYGFLTEEGTVNENATAPEMSRDDAETMVDSMFGCTEVMDTMENELARSMGEQTAETRKCFAEALTEEAVRGLLVATFSGDDEQAGKELMGPLMKCAMGGTDLPDQ